METLSNTLALGVEFTDAIIPKEFNGLHTHSLHAAMSSQTITLSLQFPLVRNEMGLFEEMAVHKQLRVDLGTLVRNIILLPTPGFVSKCLR